MDGCDPATAEPRGRARWRKSLVPGMLQIFDQGPPTVYALVLDVSVESQTTINSTKCMAQKFYTD